MTVVLAKLSLFLINTCVCRRLCTTRLDQGRVQSAGSTITGSLRTGTLSTWISFERLSVQPQARACCLAEQLPSGCISNHSRSLPASPTIRMDYSHKIIKEDWLSKVVFDYLANFLSNSANQTKFLPSLCLVPDGLFCQSCFNLCSLLKKVINVYCNVLIIILKYRRILQHVNRKRRWQRIHNVQEGKRHQKHQIFKRMKSAEILCWDLPMITVLSISLSSIPLPPPTQANR